MARSQMTTSAPHTPHVRTVLVYGGSLNNGVLRLPLALQSGLITKKVIFLYKDPKKSKSELSSLPVY